ncbi:2-iminoacetate synthase ThiH, partial [Serratia liquefaciens]
KIPRKTLTNLEIQQEANYLKAQGFEHVLLVTGEANLTVGVDYLKNAITLLKKQFANVSMEVQPLEQDAYETLIEAGLHT